eukprot:m.22400 g.22400  ORF g.22400 m.22400 type:complete len:592 (+) comp8288_c0_seq1:94-1869(+)
MFNAGLDDEHEEYNFRELLEKINFLANGRLDHGGKRKVFISYAWEADSEENKELQGFLKRLQRDLQKTGVEVFLDVADMSGNMGDTMRENIESSHVALVIGTPRLGERAAQETNVAFEIKTILARAAEKKIKVMPLLRKGDFGKSFPKPLLDFLVRDFREDAKYSNLLIQLEDPQGLIPAIWNFRVDDHGYEALLTEYAAYQRMSAAGMGRYAHAASHADRLNHKLDVLKSQRTKMTPEASRTTALQLLGEANARAATGSEMDKLAQKMILESALPYCIDGFGEEDEKTVEVKRTLESLSHLSPTAPMSLSPADMMKALGQAGMGGAMAGGVGSGGVPMMGMPMMGGMGVGGVGGMGVGGMGGGVPMMGMPGGMGGMPMMMGMPGAAGGAPVMALGMPGTGGMPVQIPAANMAVLQQAMASVALAQGAAAGAAPSPVAVTANPLGALMAAQMAQQQAMLANMGAVRQAAVEDEEEDEQDLVEVENTLLLIHLYLLEKVKSDKGRIEDFRILLRSLKANCSTATVLEHLRTRPDFRHSSRFKGNRYHDLRNHLTTISPTELQLCLEGYFTFLSEQAPINSADQDLRSKLLPL